MLHEGRIYVRPTSVTKSAPVGLRPLKLGGKRDSYLYVPGSYRPQHPSPLVLILHGAGQHPQHGLDLLQHLADDTGMILLAPASTSHTWDLIAGHAYGPDVVLVNQLLHHVFEEYAVDPTHMAIGGFSDGASYALSLGVINGDFFTHVVAFSPGFMIPTDQSTHPRIFISHGKQDPVLSIARCSRQIVPLLREAGYDVEYNEFNSGHATPPEITQHAVNWLFSRHT
jgi:phospholipase/carboxylesterase